MIKRCIGSTLRLGCFKKELLIEYNNTSNFKADLSFISCIIHLKVFGDVTFVWRIDYHVLLDVAISRDSHFRTSKSQNARDVCHSPTFALHPSSSWLLFCIGIVCFYVH
jgi:hypothetical protein